jgi:Flp pilus assembly protein TadD
MNTRWFSSPLHFQPQAVPAGEEKYRQGMKLLERGCCIEAAASLQQASAGLGDRPEVWTGLGAAQVGMGQSVKARSSFERSLALSPDQPFVWNNLGVLLLHAEDPAAALRAFHKALALNPSLVPARRNAVSALFALGRREEAEALLPESSDRCVLLGQALRENGDLDGATEAFRQAIRLCDSQGQPKANPPGQPFTRERARKALLAAKSRLESAGIPFCLLSGTLLGIVRDGDLLAHDKDLDLGVAWGVDRGRLVDALCVGGEFTVPWIQGILPPDRPWYRSFIHAETGCALDIFFLRPEGDRFLCGTDNRPVPVLCRLRAFGFKDWEWIGRRWKVPDPLEPYLAEIYGPEWRVPDPHYDTILSNPARIPEAVPVVVCWSYFRLYEAIRDRKLARAQALISQIQARKEDPFLLDLQTRLSGLVQGGPE